MVDMTLDEARDRVIRYLDGILAVNEHTQVKVGNTFYNLNDLKSQVSMMTGDGQTYILKIANSRDWNIT